MKFGSYIQNIYQFGYVTRDMDAAKQRVKETLGIESFHERESSRIVQLHGQQSVFRINVALANFGDKQVELIEPVEGVVDFYYGGLDLSRSPLVLHHMGILIERPEDNWEPMREAVGAAGYPIVLEGGDLQFLKFAYADTRPDFGHYIEFLGLTAEALAWHRSLPDNA